MNQIEPINNGHKKYLHLTYKSLKCLVINLNNYLNSLLKKLPPSINSYLHPMSHSPHHINTLIITNTNYSI
jgi:hypothetical protein